ncbi:MAG: hypothetical protein ABIT08_16015 [Bacteroidia bacterium]
MKNFKNNKTFYIAAALMLIPVITIFVSCQKDLALTPWEPGADVLNAKAKIMFINSSSLEQTINIEHNGSGIGSLNYNDKTGFVDVATDGHSNDFFRAYTNAVLDSVSTRIDTVITSDTIPPNPDTTYVPKYTDWWSPNETGEFFSLYSANLVFTPGEIYTCYLTGGPYWAKYLNIPNNTPPSEGNCTARFINLSPDAPKILVKKSGASDTLFTAKAFLDFSPSTSLPGGSYNFEFYPTGSTSTVKTLQVNLEAGKIYNINLKGYNAGGNAPLDAELIQVN